ncbi:MAG: acylneuraminate cytidylyltransferase family protein [Bacteroidetes bacterium]|nr:acylneuraminate cytidylyltransferase family protein [Bacteroidota bacterium]MBU1580964.1 acylneuraminate cytidylyltransferase family protein [Bacteroidota bacterium]
MYRSKKIIAIIPARGGSKRIPGKNIKLLNNKPLIYWTIEAAKKSKYIDKLIVSTDDDEIAQISRQFDVQVPFLRPKKISNDNSDSISLIKHAIEFYGNIYDYVLLLQPTSPLRLTLDIENSIELLNEKIKSVVSVCEAEHSPLWSNTLPSNLSMKDFIRPELSNMRSQELPKYYRLNGAIYIAETEYIYRQNGFLGEGAKAYIMPQGRSMDIDTELDWKIVEAIVKEGII